MANKRRREGEGQSPAVRRAALRWVTIVGSLSAVLAAAFNLVFYFQTGAWQLLAVVAAMGLALICLIPAAVLARRERFEAAGWLALLAMTLAFALAELFHHGVTVYLAAGGSLLILVVGFLLLPRRWPLLLLLAAAYGAHVWVVNWLQPLPRYDMGQLGVSSDIFAICLVAFLVLAGLWAIVQIYRRIVSIRTRLPLSFVLVVLLTVVVITTAVILVVAQSGRQQVVRQLESVARIKEVEIERWTGDIQEDLDFALQDSQVMPRVLVLLQNPELSAAQEFFTWSYLSQVVERTDRLESLLLLDPDGRVILSTEGGQDGMDHSGEAYFRQGLVGFYLQPPRYSAKMGGVVAMAGRPILNAEGELAGVLAGKVNAGSLAEILGEQAWIGETGEIYLVDRGGNLLTPLRFDDRPNLMLATDGVRAVIALPDPLTGASVPPAPVGGSTVYRNYRDRTVVSIQHWLPALEAGLLAEQDQSEALSVTYALLLVIGLVALGSSVLAIGVSLVVTRSITGPLAHLTERSSQIAAGDLTLTADVVQRDEIGRLAEAFNSMTAQVRDLVGTLEERVAERTRELERRSQYLEASAEVGRAAGSILNPDHLLGEAVALIGRRTDMQAVGLLLLDESGEWAVLRAAAGEAAQSLLAQGHRVGLQDGVVGRCIRDGQGEVVTASPGRGEVAAKGDGDGQRGEKSLTDSAAEAVLPLRARGQVLGAMVVGAVRADDLDPDTMVVLQTMADQVAVALDNARLFVESQRALEAEKRAYGQVSGQAWAQLVRSRPTRGYRCNAAGVLPLLSAPGSDGQPGRVRDGVVLREERDGQSAWVPLQIRDMQIGVLRFYKAGPGQVWSGEEVALLTRMSEQLAQALESARLYRDVERSAARDRVLAEVTGRMRESLDMDAILQSAIKEMHKALALAEVEVHLG